MDYLSFSETIRFTRNFGEILDDEELARLQIYLSFLPERGDLIVGSGGIRKLRWSGTGRGKRGGVRIIYYFALGKGRILLLDVYRKSRKADLNKEEIKELRHSVEEWLEENE